MGIPVAELLVMSLPAPGQANSIKPWEGIEKFFPAESCARHLLVGTARDWEDVPEEMRTAVVPDRVKKPMHKITIKHGQEAYEFLLLIGCGLEAERQGETHICGEIKRAWHGFKSEKAGSAVLLEQIMQAIFADIKKIQSTILEKMHPISKYLAVTGRILAGISKGCGAKVLLIGQTQDITTGTAHALSSHVDEIWITHPNEREVQRRYEELHLAQKEGRVKAKVSIVPFKMALETHTKLANHIFVCTPMGEDTALDTEIINAWKARAAERSDGYILHLKGDPHARNTTSEIWREAGLVSFITPEQMQQRLQSDRNENATILAQARQACVNASLVRASGKDPRSEALTMDKEEFCERLAKGDAALCRNGGNGLGGIH